MKYDDSKVRFEVGKEYEANDPGHDSIKVLRRTRKSIVVNNGRTTWMMRINVDEEGAEFVVDHSVPKKWQDAYRYSARWEA